MNVLTEQRDLSTGATGIIVAQDFLPQLIEAKKAWGQLASAVGQKRSANGEPLKVPGVDDTANMSTIIGESVTGAPVVVSEVDPNFAGFINNVSFLSTGEIKISLAELQDSYFDLDAWIRNAFGKRIARGLSKLIVTGSTDTNFQSIITTAQQSVTVPTGGATSVDYANFVAMYSKLDPAYIQDASWVFNSTTRGDILGITDSFGRPLFVPSVNTDSLDRILGLPVVISQFHPNMTANAVGAIQLGSLTDAYTLRTAGEVSILRLNERYADQGQVAFIGYHRNSGYATPVGAPIVNLVQSAT
jgi:HK97 family phage major capsid protein